MRILSGIQPSGMLHIGNYFGMMRPAVRSRTKAKRFISSPNYHALTSLRDPEALRDKQPAAWRSIFSPADSIRNAARFFCQSDVPQVTELAWILSTVTPMGLLERATLLQRQTRARHGRAQSGCSLIRC